MSNLTVGAYNHNNNVIAALGRGDQLTARYEAEGAMLDGGLTVLGTASEVGALRNVATGSEATRAPFNGGVGVVNTGLGRGAALNRFNAGIVHFEPVHLGFQHGGYEDRLHASQQAGARS